MSSLAEKLVWIKDSLPAVMDEEGQMTKDAMLELVTGLLSRFDEEGQMTKDAMLELVTGLLS